VIKKIVMIYNSWDTNRAHYNSNYYVAYHYIMNKTVPSISIISSTIGLIICVLLWKMIYDEMHKEKSKITPSVTNALIAFTLTNTIGQLVAFLSSIVFLYFYKYLEEPSSTYNNEGAHILAVLHIWIRLANSCLIFIMLLKSIVNKEFYLWNHIVVYSVVGPLILSIYAAISDVTGFNFSQLPLGSCGIVMGPTQTTFLACFLWVLIIEIADVILFVFNGILIINLFLEKSKNKSNDIRIVAEDRQPLITNLNQLLIFVSSVMMIAKALEVIRIMSVVCMFAKMSSTAATNIGIFNYSLLIMQALLECVQPVLTYVSLQTFVRGEDTLFFWIRKRLVEQTLEM